MLADFPRERVADVGENLDYQQRKERGLCTYPGCPHPAGDECLLCEKHQRLAARRKRRSRRRHRRLMETLAKNWARKRLCLRCGGKRVSGQEHCAKCLVVIGKAGSLVSHKDRDKQQRIEAATSIDRDGRSRYRGQGKRGRQSVAAIDDKDLEYATGALKRGVDGLAFSRSSTVAAQPRIQRKDVTDAALAELLQARRFLGEVLVRHGVIDPDDDDDDD